MSTDGVSDGFSKEDPASSSSTGKSTQASSCDKLPPIKSAESTRSVGTIKSAESIDKVRKMVSDHGSQRGASSVLSTNDANSERGTRLDHVMELGTSGVLPTYIYKDIMASLHDDEFLMNLMKWAFKNCDDFPEIKDETDPYQHEQKLSFTILHNEYKEMFENQAQKVLTEAGYDVTHVIDMFRRFLRDHSPSALKDFDEAGMAGILDSLTASEDYIAFFRYMQNVKVRKEWAKSIMPGEDLSGFFG